MVDNPVQLHIDFENLQVSDQEDECYSGVSDVSVELQLLEYSPEQPASLNIERSIVSYLKELGIKMKTDPRAKQERYFKRKRQFKRAQTTFMEEKEINSTTMTPPQISKKPTMQLQMNSIIGRRTPQNLGSTPLLQFPNKVTEKSKFSLQRDTSSSPV
ncbi:unnamed protein product (macronuclear) [Paramecium tetraurelia]|uniref:Uncharacterized protein n=1 Tax=Paramecium tetraurelia TaxID=5888 RepID=A0EG66_PARTE|nr:uncharacterized protein GSPATT00026631001 [Paramecium tetraurelia]CAK94307.1 unnamed protein product [Paramecium tetraurelia]|eukprot:XP_001461680.1 hypothetical protein (macronuclear) [Paramecium tetraurelia strain d4-2]